MSEATELLERMEHAGHGGGHGGAPGGPGKMIGITMAALGVMLAFCAAMVGSERTDLIRATIDQSLPLAQLLALVPQHAVIGLEIPIRSEAQAGLGPHARLGRCVVAARELLG